METQLKSNPPTADKSTRPKLTRARRAALRLAVAAVFCGGAGMIYWHSF